MTKLQILICHFLFLVFLGCAHPEGEICTQDLDRWIQTINAMMSRIEKKAPTIDLSPEANLEKWSEEQLIAVQKRMERALKRDRKKLEYRTHLSTIANLWVEFHSYAQLRQTRRMMETLHQIRKHYVKLDESFCSL